MQESEVIQLATLTCFQVMTTLYLQQDQITCTYDGCSISNENQYVILKLTFTVYTSVKCTFSANAYEIVADVMSW